MIKPKQTYYLSSGFPVELNGRVRGGIRFPTFQGPFKRAPISRLALIEFLSKGGSGALTDQLQPLAKKYGVLAKGLQHFSRHLQDTGFLHETPQAPQFAGEPATRPGRVRSDRFAIAAPTTFLAEQGFFHWYNHHGELKARLTLGELFAAASLPRPTTLEDAWAFYQEQNYPDSLDKQEYTLLVARLDGAGLLVEPDLAFDIMESDQQFNVVDAEKIQQLVDERVARHDEEIAASGKALTQVVPVHTRQGIAPQALGLIVAYAMEFEDQRLRERYNFVPMFFTDEERLLQRACEPGVFLFSNYLWNLESNLALSAAIKAANPASITIHGGPSTPKYLAESDAFFADNPHVDITVRGEGEATFAEILDKLDVPGRAGLDVLHDVTGLTYRTADGTRRTEDRERIADLNTIPSPFLMGLFEEFGSVRAGAIVESNRGCPYGCTFCDWGSATLSKVRRFDLDRVYKELEWCAERQIEDASIADANFGMLERDVEITEKVADLKRNYGYPRTVSINYAKNQVRHLKKIIQIMANVGILTEGKVSLQSMDEQTLEVIDRSNIKLEKYNELATEFRRARLPLAAEIMMGLPGSTAQSFRDDLQKCTDRDIRAMLNPTQLLPNSPMNDPNYRQEHGIVAKPGELLTETATYSRDDWDDMYHLRSSYYLLDSYGLLRYVARYVRSESGMGEVEFYDKVRSAALHEPREWPIMALAINTMEKHMSPPASWGLFLAEVRRFITERLGLPDTPCLQTAFDVQLAHLPAPGRRFPDVMELQHDFAGWWETVLTSREEGHRDDWEQHTPRLSEFGPATLTIEDPNRICQRDLGSTMYVLLINIRTWELDSPVTRPRVLTEAG